MNDMVRFHARKLSILNGQESIALYRQVVKLAYMNESPASRVKAAMKSIGVEKDADIARMLGISKSAISQWKPTTKISPDVVVKTEKLTGFSARYLISGEGSPKNHISENSTGSVAIDTALPPTPLALVPAGEDPIIDDIVTMLRAMDRDGRLICLGLVKGELARHPAKESAS